MMVDSVDRAGLRTADATVGIALASLQTTPNDVLLYHVERGPQAIAHIFAAARLDDLFGPQRAFVLTIAGNKADLAKQATFVLGKPNRFHGLAGVDEAWDRSEARRVGKAVVSTCRYRWAAAQLK